MIPRARGIPALAGALLLAGCASFGPPPEEGAEPAAGGERTRPEAPPRESPSPRLVERATDLLASGRAGLAAQLADSLYFHFRAAGRDDAAEATLHLAARARLATGDTLVAAELLAAFLERFPGADRAGEVVLQLAELHLSLGDDPAAAAVLVNRRSVDERRREALLSEAAGQMSVSELEATIADSPDDAARPALALLREELERARLEAERESSVRIGLLLPSSGRLASVGGWVREGVSLAMDVAPEGAPEIELVAVDLASGRPVEEQARQLTASGVAAVIGPIRSDELEGASRAVGHLPVVSPTATRGPVGPRPAYALWDRERRELDAAGSLGRWLGRAARPVNAAVLYPDNELGRRSYLAFRRGLGAGGGGVAAAVPFDADATTIEEPVRTVAAFGPSVIFVPAQGTGQVLQLAPQLSYYGIRGAVVAGGTDWSEPSAVRRVEPSYTQLRIVATYLDRSEGGAWARFTERYERTYRKSLGSNVLPGLGHDAALLVLEALAETRPARPRALARAIARLREVPGATGVLGPDAMTGTVARRVEVRKVADMELTGTSSAEVRRWLDRAGELVSTQARRRRAEALRAVREAGIEVEGGAGAGGRR